jgi:hypothetical protein
MIRMAKKQSTKSKQAAKTGQISSPKVAGMTTDGIVVLRAKAKPLHFTAQQIRETIRKTGLMLSSKSTAKG